jgi:hypothetical protein
VEATNNIAEREVQPGIISGKLPARNSTGAGAETPDGVKPRDRQEHIRLRAAP